MPYGFSMVSYPQQPVISFASSPHNQSNKDVLPLPLFTTPQSHSKCLVCHSTQTPVHQQCLHPCLLCLCVMYQQVTQQLQLRPWRSIPHEPSTHGYTSLHTKSSHACCDFSRPSSCQHNCDQYFIPC